MMTTFALNRTLWYGNKLSLPYFFLVQLPVINLSSNHMIVTHPKVTKLPYLTHMMICGSGTDAPMDLCGRTWPPLMYISSFTITSSPSTVVFSMRTHCPTTLLHPMMQPSSQECERTVAPRSSVLRFTHTPSSITTPGPTVTFGPMRQPCPILAVGSTRTFPTMPGPKWRLAALF